MTRMPVEHSDDQCPICRNYCAECSRDLRRDPHSDMCLTGRTLAGQSQAFGALWFSLLVAVGDAFSDLLARFRR